MLDPVTQLKIKLSATIADEPQLSPQQQIEAALLVCADVLGNVSRARRPYIWRHAVRHINDQLSGVSP